MRSLLTVDDGGEPAGSPAALELASLLGQVRLAMVAGVDAEFLRTEKLAELDVSTAQFIILRKVLKGSAESACELCKQLDYDRGAMSRMIDRLESKGLIRRVPLAHTRRTVALEVTDAGKAALPLMDACVERVVEGMLQGLTKSQVREMEKALQRMLSNA
jgi:DNA-binding MarR family transcriptional regulator